MSQSPLTRRRRAFLPTPPQRRETFCTQCRAVYIRPVLHARVSTCKRSLVPARHAMALATPSIRAMAMCHWSRLISNLKAHRAHSRGAGFIIAGIRLDLICRRDGGIPTGVRFRQFRHRHTRFTQESELSTLRRVQQSRNNFRLQVRLACKDSRRFRQRCRAGRVAFPHLPQVALVMMAGSALSLLILL